MTPAAKAPLAAYSLESLSNVLAKEGFEVYRGSQVLEWFYGKNAADFALMKNLPARLRSRLDDEFVISSSTLAGTHDSGDGAVKLEIRLFDDEVIEAVVIRSSKRVTLCVSCQAGCPLGCTFCATGAGGFSRSLLAHEIVEQARHAASVLAAGERISHVVFMGMGEPALNLDAVFDAVRIMNAPYAFGIGARRITISTLGDPEAVRRIGEFPMEVGLAISLHSGEESKRRTLVPNAPASVSDTVSAAREYFRNTGREVTFEYVLLAGTNDSAGDAARLAAVLRGARAYVNVIPFNEAPDLPYRRPTAARAARFRDSLVAHGVNAEVRTSRGGGASAACGQLRSAAKGGRR